MTAITQSVDLDRRGRVAVLTVNNPPVNALSQHVRQGLHDGLKQAIADGAVGAIVIVCGGRTFIAGADITEFGKPPVPPGLDSLSAPQRALADFLRLDADLLTVAAEASPPLTTRRDDPRELASWITGLPIEESSESLK